MCADLKKNPLDSEYCEYTCGQPGTVGWRCAATSKGARLTCRIFQEFMTPVTAAEAVKLRQQLPSAIYLAGGTEINSTVWPCRPTTKARVAISLDKIPMREITVSPSGMAPGDDASGPAGIKIGANVTIQELVDGNNLPPMLVAAARLFSNRNVRTRATIGGNVAGNRSCTNIAPTLLALTAQVIIMDAAGEKLKSLEEYSANHDPSTLITAVLIPPGWNQRRWAVRKHSRTNNDVSIVSVGVSMSGNRNNIEKPIIAVNGVVPHATRLTALEQRLDGKPLPPRAETDELVKDLVSPIDDLRGSAEFKRHLAGVLVSDALAEAAGREG